MRFIMTHQGIMNENNFMDQSLPKALMGRINSDTVIPESFSHNISLKLGFMTRFGKVVLT